MSVLRDVPGFRDGRGTLCHGGKASGVEGAAAGDGDGAGQVALKDDAFRLPCGVWQGDGGEESLGYRGGWGGQRAPASPAYSTTLPRYMTATWVETRRTTRRSWETKTSAMSQLLLQVHEQVDDLGLDRHIQGGDALVTDDQLGDWTDRARAIQSRWRRATPENSWGNFRMLSWDSPTRSSSSSARFMAASRLPSLSIGKGSARISETRWRGLREASGS